MICPQGLLKNRHVQIGGRPMEVYMNVCVCVCVVLSDIFHFILQHVGIMVISG